jgi:hypothetical protein
MQGAAGLFGSAALEVAVGLLFLYFLLSSICSSIHELFASALKWRAKNLEFALGNLINDPDLLKQVINHPLIRSMGQTPSPVRGQLRDQTTLEGQPSYIPRQTFSAALLHALSNPPTLADAERDWTVDITRVRRSAFVLATNDVNAAKQLTGQALLAVMEQTRDPRAAAEGLDSLKQHLQAGLAATPTPPGAAPPQIDLSKAANVDQVYLALKTLPDGAPKDWALHEVEAARHELDAASYKIADVRAGFETWFDDAMDRTSGLYKRNTLRVLAVIALVLTLATGADSIRFITRLYVDSTLRTQLAQEASSAALAQPSATTGQPATGQPATGQSLPSQSSSVSATLSQIELVSTLFGYADVPATFDARFVISRIAGEALTIFALLMGAPFWFELLVKLVNLRGSGPPPASTAQAQRAATRTGRT